MPRPDRFIASGNGPTYKLAISWRGRVRGQSLSSVVLKITDDLDFAFLQPAEHGELLKLRAKNA
jgi:hypothetical protein